jgi:hypothetical protein
VVVVVVIVVGAGVVGVRVVDGVAVGDGCVVIVVEGGGVDD